VKRPSAKLATVSLEAMAKGIRKCCIYDNVNGRNDGVGVGNVGIRDESASSECEAEDGHCQDTEAETNDRNGEQSKVGEAD
jgi:hypothetical protein